MHGERICGETAVGDEDEVPEVTFDLLGPLTVTVGGAPVGVGASKLRILLASLLLRPGEVLSVDVLVDRLWGEELPPAGARNAIHTYVRRLRALLGAAAGVIVTKPSGYCVEVPSNAIDVLRFHRHLEQARAAAAAGDIEAEDRQLRAGLALWRGAPLADVDAESIQRDEVPLLVEGQLQALEQRVDVDLRRGRQAELVAELRALTAEYPLRERFSYQLMLALYRCHRQAEALNAFREVSTLLRDELGVDPGTELVQLHGRILAADPELDAPPVPAPPEPAPPAPAPPANGWLVACQLPPEVVDFVGRAELVADVVARCAPSPDTAPTGLPLVLLSGPPGVGKSELAIHVAYQLRAQFPDGQLFVNLRGFSRDAPIPPAEALGLFLRALGVPAARVPPRTDERAALFRSMLTGRRVLLVLDNAGSPDQVRPLLPGDPTCSVIVTSRDSLVGLTAVNGAHRVPVEPVTGPDAEALLSAIIGADRARAEPAALAELTAACGYLPLALRITASNLAAIPGQTIAQYAQELRCDERLGTLAVDGDEQASICTTFDLSYCLLKPAVAQLFRLLSLIPGHDFDRFAAASVAGVSPVEAGRMLHSLVCANLVQAHRDDRYQFHDLIRDYARLQADQEDGSTRQTASRRLLDYYLQVADAASQLLYRDFPRIPIPDPPAGLPRPDWASPLEALNWLETEAMNLTAAVSDPLLQESGAPVWLLADSLLGHFVRQRQDAAWLATFRSALTAAQRHGDPTVTAALQRGLGRLHFRSNEYHEARDWYVRSAELSRGLGDLAGEGRDQIGLAGVAFELQDYLEAARCIEAAIPLLRASGDREGVASALVNYGLTLIMIGRSDDGAAALVQGRALAEELDLHGVSPRAAAGLALMQSWRGEFERATVGFEHVRESWTAQGFLQGQAETLRNLAEIQLETGRPGQAVQLAQEALTLAEQMDSKWVAMGARVTLGEAHLLSGDTETASRHLTAAQTLTAAGSGYWYPYTQLGLAACCRIAGEHRSAAVYAQEVTGNQRPRLRARAHNELALLSIAAGDLPGAARQARWAADLSDAHGYRPEVERARGILRQVPQHTRAPG